ncbi:uncharacterized protein LOC110021858 [Phalaenopsis equestris]|uniref:uncharacterized protein LOC110021858 n=1 Tax=Phalaenopsis equestris TaxID=78828 RepID=UPI0009E454B3|nr:uncharacterized protein LOC110021858 [Phalaenopsis equestris]
MMSYRRTMNREMEQQKKLLHSSSSSASMPTPVSSESETDDEDVEVLQPPKTWTGNLAKKVLSKQLSMRDMEREAKWEKKKRQMYLRSQSDGLVAERDLDGKEEGARTRRERVRSLTDEDMDELRGSVELGFGFSEDNGGRELCKTLPALNLLFALNRQSSDTKLRQTPSPASTPTAAATTSSSPMTTLFGTPSPRTPNEQSQLEQGKTSVNPDDDTWQIFKPGDSPEQMKTKLRHWAQIVACSVRQGY